MLYRVVQKRTLFYLKLCFRSFCFIFQAVWTVLLRNCFDVNMDDSGRYTMQQQTKRVEGHFVTKSVVLTQAQCRRDFGRDKVPDR